MIDYVERVFWHQVHALADHIAAIFQILGGI